MTEKERQKKNGIIDVDVINTMSDKEVDEQVLKLANDLMEKYQKDTYQKIEEIRKKQREKE